MVRDRSGLKEDIVTKIEKVMLRLGHKERMNPSRLTKEIDRANVVGYMEEHRLIKSIMFLKK